MKREFRFLFNKLPFYLIFYPTSRCNASCPHCFNYQRHDESSIRKELSLEEIEKISRNIEHIKVLTITGGEPFLRDDLLDIISIFHKNNGLQYVSFHTNAFLTDKVVRTVRESVELLRDVNFIVCISIDAIGKAHDDFRNTPGGFNRLVKTISELKKVKERHPNLNLISSTIFSRTTEGSFLDTIRFIEKEIGGIKPSLSFIRGGVMENSEKDIDYKRYEDFYRDFIPAVSARPFSTMAVKDAIEIVANNIVVESHIKNRQIIPCCAGEKLIVIYDNGDVYPCEMLPDKFGNLRDVDYNIKRLLFSAKGKDIRERIKKEKSCFCTWENIIPVNILYSPRYYPLIIREWLRLFLLRRKRN